MGEREKEAYVVEGDERSHLQSREKLLDGNETGSFE